MKGFEVQLVTGLFLAIHYSRDVSTHLLAATLTKLMSAAPGVSQAVSRPSIALAQCCLASEFKWELVDKKWQLCQEGDEFALNNWPLGQCLKQRA